ncbi:MAG: methyltransferase, CheR-type [Armatimonadetes bacterium]|jgi:chemotaxis protein methyltransferase CheR|nr:methyltransferase, CheR-type [Armatimonadota bacterium]
MDDLLVHRLRHLLRARTGWSVGEQDTERLREKVTTRLRARRLAPEAYCRLLEGDEAEGSEWQELIGLLVNPETFFFRDAGQMALLKGRILPELIARRRPQRSLRIWSAGCSTGEEAYSLAMLVYELLPDRESWHVMVLGTDVSRAALEKARRARYGQWSLRASSEAPPGFLTRVGAEWQVDERIRRMVTFQAGNLLQEQFPSHAANLYEMDLILCRNVFIYFDRAAVAAVVPKLAATLREGGYLVTGHAELHDLEPPGLRAHHFAESLVHQRVSGPELPVPGRVPRISPRPPAPAPRPRLTPPTRPQVGTPAPVAAPESLETALGDAARLLELGDCRVALERAEGLLRRAPSSLPALCLAARAAAHLGDHPRAAEHCRRAMEAAPFAPEPYYLLAQVAEERGAVGEAKELLRKSLYLAPGFVPAYLELGDIYEREGDTARARKMRASALELLRAAAPDSRIEAYPGVPAGELAAQLESRLARGG